MREAMKLQALYPEPSRRPPLYGVPIGVKDIIRVDGFETRAGSRLSPDLFAGDEAACVTTLRNLGALVLGKTVTTEFAYFEPGPTRNPHHLEHTPGGSSSGSAAAVATGFCPLALGTQTVGSTIRPAAFCGVLGFKPSYGRIPMDGIIPFSRSVDHVGLFTRDVEGMRLAASLLCHDWNENGSTSPPPVLGVPEGPCLRKASPEAADVFSRQLEKLEAAGLVVQHVEMLHDVEEVAARHKRLIACEMSKVHEPWFVEHEDLYRPRTIELLREGRGVGAEEWAMAQAGCTRLRMEVETQMKQAGVNVWVCPSAVGPAPKGLGSTGDPAMNLPWTHAGLPAISLPLGWSASGLPLGLQCVGAHGTDEQLLAWAGMFTAALTSVEK